jgi:hypothetical protein
VTVDNDEVLVIGALRIARSRSEALAWCVELVGRNEAAWIDELRSAFSRVEEVRAQGPSSNRSEDS